MITRSLTLFFALATFLLLLAGCEEETSQETSALNDTAVPATDTTGTTGSPTDTSAMAAGTTRTGNVGTAAGQGIDTTGSGPASIPQDRYTTTSSGLKYYDLQEGSGPSPSATDRVRVHYTGWLQSNGQKFDSSYDRGEPATFLLNRVIKGWTEGLQSMEVGGKRQLVVPPNLAYGKKGSGSIPPNATLVFEVKLLGIEGQTGRTPSGGTGSR